MKKLLSAAMALVMGLSMGAPVLAEGAKEGTPPPYEDQSTIEIKKDITSQGVNPAETFEFTVGDGVVTGTGVSGVNAPAINDFSIVFAQGDATASTDLELPPFSHVGVYTYTIKEKEENTAGMRYDGETYRLQVTVFNNAANDGFDRVVTIVDGKDVKNDAFQNKFFAGDLVVNKEITGNFAQQDDQFEVTVELTSDKTIKEGPITVTGAVGDTGDVTKDEETGVVTVTFTVTGNSEVTIANVPYDVSYVVSEENGDYTPTFTNETGSIDAASQEVGIVNKLEEEVNTGVNLDNLPYILVLALVGVGLISVTVRKRVQN